MNLTKSIKSESRNLEVERENYEKMMKTLEPFIKSKKSRRIIAREKWYSSTTNRRRRKE